MSVTIDDLAADLRKFFASKLPAGGGDGPGSVLLVFDAFGRPLPASEFIGSGNPGIQNILAHQRAADLADQLPAGNALAGGAYLARSGSRLSRLYESIVAGGRPSAVDEETLSAFEAGKSRALGLLETNKLVVTSGTAAGGQPGTVPAVGTHDHYYATSMSPVDWYSPEATSWQTYKLDAANSPPPTPTQPSGTSSGTSSGTTPEASPAMPLGPVVIPDFHYQVADDELVQLIVELNPSGPEPCPIEISEVVPDRLVVIDEVPARGGVVPDLVPRRFTNFTIPEERLSAVRRAAVVLDNAALEFQASNLISVSDTFELSDFSGRTRSTLIEAAVTGTELFDVAAVNAVNPELLAERTTSTTPAANDMHVSFEYCLVRFDRPWWDELFIGRRGWNLPGFVSGDLSTGSAANPTGLVTLITTGMLVIRKLMIKAAWTEQDAKAMRSSVSLGPFCLTGSVFDAAQGTITVDGMQAVAWLCQVPPILPPAG